jgi:hypothetical protein
MNLFYFFRSNRLNDDFVLALSGHCRQVVCANLYLKMELLSFSFLLFMVGDFGYVVDSNSQ